MTLGETLRHQARISSLLIGKSELVVWKQEDGWDVRVFQTREITPTSWSLYEHTMVWLQDILEAHPDAVVISKDRGDLEALKDESMRSICKLIQRIHKTPGKYSLRAFLEGATA